MTVAIASVAGEALAQVGSERHAVDALRVGNVADDFPGYFIDDHHMRSARDVNAVRIGIDAQIVPAAVATHRHSADDCDSPSRAVRRRLRSRK